LSEGEGKGPSRLQWRGGPSTPRGAMVNWPRGGFPPKGGDAPIGTTVRLLLSGEVQDGPFEGHFARALGRRSAALRRVGAALEVRAAPLGGETPAGATRALRAAVARASRSSGSAVEVVAARVDDGSLVAPGLTVLEAALGSSDAHRARPSARPDLAPCAECARELLRPGRRHGYMRTECAACGPRFSAAVGFPMTRARYGLGAMPPCAACTHESRDPKSRRFDFARVSCAECGPTPALQPASGAPWVKAAVRRAVERLREGEVVAVQTPYGFLAAALPSQLGALRVEIGNEFAPLALVVGTPSAAREFARLSPAEAREIFAPRAPELTAFPLPRKAQAARELSVFGGSVRLRAPDSPPIALLCAGAGPLAVAAASRGGEFLPGAPQPGATLPTALWLTDGTPIGDPIPPNRGFVFERRFVLLAHGRGSLPASLPLQGSATALAFGGGAEAFGAAAFAGAMYLTGSAGLSGRAESGVRLQHLLSRAAALSPGASADALDFVVAAPDEGSPARLAADETAASADCPVHVISSAAARAAAATLSLPRGPRAAVVLSADEPCAEGDGWLGAARTGGDVIDAAGLRLQGGIAPFEVVEAPGGRNDLVAPLASLFDRAGLPREGATREDAPILEVLRGRAEKSSSFVLLTDAVAAALGLVPRRAPKGAGLAEAGRAALASGAARRFALPAKLTRARGGKQVDAAGLLRDLSTHIRAAHAREGRALPWDRRASLAASFASSLLDGVARSARAHLGRGSRVALTGTAFAEPSVVALAFGRFRAAGLRPEMPAGVPLLDGAIPIGQLHLASARASRPSTGR